MLERRSARRTAGVEHEDLDRAELSLNLSGERGHPLEVVRVGGEGVGAVVSQFRDEVVEPFLRT